MNANGKFCPTGKKVFHNSSEADSFARQWAQSHPGSAVQESYACEECPGWHLSCATVEGHSTVQSNLNNAPQTWAPGLPSKYQHLQTKIKELYTTKSKAKGGPYFGIVTEVLEELGIPCRYENGYGTGDYARISQWLRDIGLHKPKENRVAGSRRHGTSTIEDLTNEEQEMEAKLGEIRRKKQGLIEAKRTKLEHMVNFENEPVIAVRKEGNTIILTHDEAFELVDRLTSFMANLPANPVRA